MVKRLVRASSEPSAVGTRRSSSLIESYLTLILGGPGWCLTTRKGGCELANPEAQRKIWRGAASNGRAVFGIALPATLGAGLEQALAGLDQGGDFGCVQRAAIEADCADFAIERLRDFEVGSLCVELGAAHVCFRCEETVDVEKRFVVATADDNGDVAPLIPMEDPGAGGERGGRGLGPPRRVGTQ